MRKMSRGMVIGLIIALSPYSHGFGVENQYSGCARAVLCKSESDCLGKQDQILEESPIIPPMQRYSFSDVEEKDVVLVFPVDCNSGEREAGHSMTYYVCVGFFVGFLGAALGAL